MTLACLRSVAAGAAGVAHEVIVVDNASPDGSAGAIAAADIPGCRLIALDENLGFGRANNLAAAQARGRLLLLLNPDTLVPPGALAALTRFAASRPEARLWGGRTTFADGALNAKSCWRDMSLWSLLCGVTGLSAVFRGSEVLNPEGYGGWRRDTVREVDIVTGCFLLIEAGLWRALDGFDPRFFMYAEEADLCLRARRLGARPLVTPDAAIVHYGGASEPARAGKVARLFAGRITFMRKHWSAPAFRLGQGLFLLHVLTRALGFGLAARLTGRVAARRNAEEWRALWRARDTWLGGYAPPRADARTEPSTMPDKPLTIGLLWHSANSDNLGVGALTVSQIAIAGKVAAAMGTPVRFVVLGWDDARTPYVDRPDVRVVKMRARDLARPGGLYGEARGCDVVLDIGAGDSFADIYGARRATFVIGSKFVVLAARRPLVLSPQTIGPFNGRWSRRFALAAMRRARAVFTRDRLSTEFLAGIGFRGAVEEATDVALRLPYTPRARGDDGRVRVGINVSGLLFNGGYTRNNMFALASDYAALMRAAIGNFMARPECEVHLVAHVISDAMPVEDDWTAAEALSREFPGTVLAPRFASPSEAKSYISGMDFFFGSRMHACIAAFSSGVPVTPLAYSRKFAGLFGTLGYDRTADCRSDSAEAILARLDADYEGRAALAEAIALAMAEGERRLDRYEAALRTVFAGALAARR